MATDLLAATAPVTRTVRAFFAPVDRATGAATMFDPAGIAGFDVDAPIAPWVDLGCCTGFTRKSETKIEPLVAGAPGFAVSQVRTEIEALLSVEFESWGKLQMALTCGAQQLNVLRASIAAVPLNEDSTATTLDVGATVAAGFLVGDVVAVDVDYSAQTGFIGSGVSGAYVQSAAAIGTDTDYVRRITLNVGRVTAIAGGTLTLGSALLAGVPIAGMQVSRVVGFCDREGARFFQEWSALFVVDGVQGDRMVFHYPRLQAASGIAEKSEGLAGVQAGSLEKVSLAGSFRALPVKDATDGEMVVCFRSYLPGAMRTV